MRKALAVAMLLVLLGGWALAQSEVRPQPNTTVYKFDFVISEVEDGKRVNSRTYTLMLKENTWGNTNASTRVPVVTGGGSPAAPTQFQYMDVGLSLRYRFHEEGNFVLVEGASNIDSFAMPEQAQTPTGMPVTRRISSDVAAAVVPGKPTIISSVDDTNTKKRYQVEVTATKIK
jgi:hypothetical protein